MDNCYPWISALLFRISYIKLYHYKLGIRQFQEIFYFPVLIYCCLGMGHKPHSRTEQLLSKGFSLCAGFQPQVEAGHPVLRELEDQGASARQFIGPVLAGHSGNCNAFLGVDL